MPRGQYDRTKAKQRTNQSKGVLNKKRMRKLTQHVVKERANRLLNKEERNLSEIDFLRMEVERLRDKVGTTEVELREAKDTVYRIVNKRIVI